MTIAERSDVEERLQFEIDPALQQRLFEHAGKWVALTRSEIIAIADTPSEAFHAAQEAGITDPILYRVPEDKDTVYFL
jgi:hypothetical protein